MRKSTLLAALLLLAPGISQAKSLEDLLVEKGVITKGEARASSAGGPSKVYWNNGTRVGFPDTGFDFGINTLIKTRYTFNDNDSDSGEENNSSFDVVNARIIIKGSALNNEFEYALNTDLVSNTEGDAKSPELLDAYIKWNPCDTGYVKMGQWKTGVGRQFGTADEALQFADSSIAANYFNLGRQQGAGVGFDVGSVALTASIFNGESTGEGINGTGVDTRHTGVVTARFNALGEMNVNEEGDVDGTDDLALNFGAAYAYSQYEDASGQVDRQLASIDANLKSEGASVHAEFFWNRSDPEDSTVSVEPYGGYIQAGYFVTPKELEVAGRYSVVKCEETTTPGLNGVVCDGNNDITQATVGVNYHWWRHHVKAQFNIDYIEQDGAAPANDEHAVRYIVQLQSYL